MWQQNLQITIWLILWNYMHYQIYIHIYALNFSVHEADKGCSVPHTQQGRKLWRSPVNANKGKRLLLALRKANVEIIIIIKKKIEMIFQKLANVLQLATNLIRGLKGKHKLETRWSPYPMLFVKGRKIWRSPVNVTHFRCNRPATGYLFY